MKGSLAAAGLLWTLVIAPQASAQVPQLINYQGRLLNGTNLVNGNVGLALRLFNVASGGSVLYEDSTTVTVVDGLYSTFIGDNPASSAFLTALTNAQVYVEVAVNGVALSPRERLASVGYSLATRGLSVTPDGNVGIGTISPQAGLHITSGPRWSTHNLGANILVDGGRNNAIGFLDSSSGKPWAIFNGAGQFRMAQMPPLGDIGTAPEYRLAISTNGNVGIGTLTPAEKLEVAGWISLNGPYGKLGDLSTLVDSAKMLIGWNQSGGGGEADFIANRGAGNIGGFAFYDLDNSGTLNQLMTMKGNGNVGIGTASPAEPLEVAGRILLNGPNANLDGDDLSSLANSGKMLIGCNITRGEGETDFIANRGAGWGGGFAFFDMDNGGATNRLMTLKGDGNVGIGTTAPGAKLHVEGQVKIVGGNPGAGKLLVSDANGLASWQAPSALSLFIGQDYTVLFPDVIDNTVTIQIDGVFTEDRVVMVNGPGLQIERILGFNGADHNDNPGPNMEFPLVFEYGGPQTNDLQTWYEQNQTAPDLKGMSVIVKDLGGAERARWNLYEMALTQIDPGAGARKRYTLRHALAPNNHFHYEREPSAFPDNSSRNPATDGPRVLISGLTLGPYPAVALDTTNRTITLTFDYTEAGNICKWVEDTASGLETKQDLSIIQEVNGTEVSRRNYFEVFPIWYQQTTGFGQIEKLKEKVVISYNRDESA